MVVYDKGLWSDSCLTDATMRLALAIAVLGVLSVGGAILLRFLRESPGDKADVTSKSLLGLWLVSTIVLVGLYLIPFRVGPETVRIAQAQGLIELRTCTRFTSRTAYYPAFGVTFEYSREQARHGVRHLLLLRRRADGRVLGSPVAFERLDLAALRQVAPHAFAAFRGTPAW